MKQVEHLQVMLARMRREFVRKYCLHPSAPHACSKNIVSAHSVQKALLKEFISEKGHVVQIKISAHVKPTGILAKPESVSIHDATTFSGFCGKHDNDVFRPLEFFDFTFTRAQIALLGFRAVCRELYLKQAEIASADSIWSYCSVNPDVVDFDAKKERHEMTQMARRNALVNLLEAKSLYSQLIADDSDLCYYALEFCDPPVYFCSVSFLPEWDFEGKQLQDSRFMASYKPICFSAWATKNHAVAVFCWHKSASGVCTQFVDSLRRIKPDQVAGRLLSMAFEVSDNVVFRSDWWEMLHEGERQLLVDRAFSGLGEVERTQTSLCDDGFRALTARVSSEHIGY